MTFSLTLPISRENVLPFMLPTCSCAQRHFLTTLHIYFVWLSAFSRPIPRPSSSHSSLLFAAMSMSSTTPPTRPMGLASIAGLPAAAHEVLHRELLHIHSSLHLILLILRGPLDSVTPSVVDSITCPRLSATLRALETSIEQIRRSTCTTLVYADALCSTLAFPHPIGQSVSSPPSFSSSRHSLILFPSPPSPPVTTTMTTTTDPSPPQAPPPSLTPSAPPSTLTRMPISHSPSRSRSPPRRFRL